MISTRWKSSEVAQTVMRREGLADENELQSYFIRRIEQHLLAGGRRLIAWDEILEGGLTPQATVMSWRGISGGIEAAKAGHDVIMTPNGDVYFDYYQGDRKYEPLAIGGFLPLERVYRFDPVPEDLTADEAAHIIGAQANLWTEYIKTPEHAEYMLLPRMLALSEVVWSRVDRRDWDSFLERLPNQFRLLGAAGYNYRVPVVIGLDEDVLTLDDIATVELASPIPGAEVRYATDPSAPFRSWGVYGTPFDVNVAAGPVTVVARLVLSSGERGATKSATYSKTTLRPAEQVDAGSVLPGLDYTYHEVEVRSVNQLTDAAVSESGTASDIGFQGVERPEQFGLTFTGFFRAEVDGLYRFTLSSDDGSRFWLANVFRIDNDGLHGTVVQSGAVALAAGLHPIHLRYFQAGGGRSLSLTFSIEESPVEYPVAGRVFRAR